MSQALKDLQEKRAKLAAEIKAHAEVQDKWDAEGKAKWDTLNADYDANFTALTAERERVEKEENDRKAVSERLSKLDEYKDFAPSANKPRFGKDNGGRQLSPTDLLNGQYNGDQLCTALHGWLLSGSHLAGDVGEKHHNAASALGMNLQSPVFVFNLNKDWSATRHGVHRFRNALSGEDGTQGGYTKDQTLMNSLELAMLAYGGIMQVAEVIRTGTGEPFRWPTANDTSNTGRQVGENASHDSGTDPNFGSVMWNAYTFTSDIVKVPNELMTDSVFNLAQVLGTMLGERLGRVQNTKYTVGTGSGTAKGIVTCATAGVSAASATAIAFDELIDLEHSVDPSRRRLPGVGYMFHDSILKALRKLKDGEGRYLWQAGANSGAPDTLNTYPYTVNQDMASSIASAAITVLFGELSAYKVRQVGQVVLRRLDERFADNNQTGFLAIMRGDGNLLDAGDHPVKKLTN